MTFLPEYFAAFSIGFLGSLHCLGMCGPIAMMTPSLFSGTIGRILGGLIYSFGRTITYASLGVFAGMIGAGFAFFRLQQIVSISLGVMIVLYVLLPVLFSNKGLGHIMIKTGQLFKKGMNSVISRRGFSGILAIGLVNGLLPCGLVYIGLAGSLESGTPVSGAIFMAFFGLGTVPMMSGIHLFGSKISLVLRGRLSGWIKTFAILVGLLFIVRGLGLGIPYLSPKLVEHAAGVECYLPEHRHP